MIILSKKKYQIQYLHVLDCEDKFFGIISQESVYLWTNSKDLLKNKQHRSPMITDLIDAGDRDPLKLEE